VRIVAVEPFLRAMQARGMIVFTAKVWLDEGTNLEVLPKGRRFSPNLRFALPSIEGKVFGLSVMEPESVMRSGDSGKVVIRLIGTRDHKVLSDALVPGVHFELRQGPILLGSGVVLTIEDLGIDEEQ
jgi:hypothetical protein